MKERKKKQCKFDGCIFESYSLSKNLCPYHYSLSKGTPTKKYYLRKQTEKNKEKRRKRGELLQVYYEYHLKRIKSHLKCENCGCKIQGSTCNIAHIIPKHSSVEVMDNLENVLYLCGPFDEIGRNCHGRFDKIQNSTQVYLMNCWALAVERYLKFRNEITKYNKSAEIFKDWIEENDIVA